MNDENIKLIETLSTEWRKLKSSLDKIDEMSVSYFIETFTKTEQFLSKYISENTIEKDCVPLIVDAYSFVDSEVGNDNVEMQAAKILTERMLYQYVINPEVNDQNASCVTIYMVNSRRQLKIDLTNAVIAFAIIKEALTI